MGRTEQDALRALRNKAVQRAMPDGASYLSLSLADLRVVARDFSISLRELEALALGQDLVPERYVRNFKTFSAADQVRLLSSCAALVGLGGLGGHVLEGLARMGLGMIRAADHDVFEESNLNRQALSSVAALDRPKADLALEQAAAVNPAVEITVMAERLDRAGMDRLLARADVAIDALGGLKDRLALQHAASDAGIPLVTAAVAGQSGYVAVVFPGRPGPAELLGSGAGAEDSLGCPAPVVALAASLQVSEAIKLLMGRIEEGPTQALLFDLADWSFARVTL